MKRAQKAIPEPVRRQLEERSGGVCEGCGQARAINMHHRKYLSRGGDHTLSNLIHLCGAGNTSGCHGRAHKDGSDNGWSVHRWETPSEIPVDYRGQLRYLTDEAAD